MQKDNATIKTPATPPPTRQASKMTAFLNKISAFANMDKMMDLGGQLQTVVRSPGKRGGFKHNQRMERKRSRIRKMKPSAR